LHDHVTVAADAALSRVHHVSLTARCPLRATDEFSAILRSVLAR
jgi:hypothetical protein